MHGNEEVETAVACVFMATISTSGRSSETRHRSTVIIIKIWYYTQLYTEAHLEQMLTETASAIVKKKTRSCFSKEQVNSLIQYMAGIKMSRCNSDTVYTMYFNCVLAIYVLTSERQHEGSNDPSVRSPVGDEERTRPGHWLG